MCANWPCLAVCMTNVGYFLGIELHQKKTPPRGGEEVLERFGKGRVLWTMPMWHERLLRLLRYGGYKLAGGCFGVGSAENGAAHYENIGTGSFGLGNIVELDASVDLDVELGAQGA